jgi:hypothetical protein
MRRGLTFGLAVVAAAALHAQPPGPRAEVTPVVETAPVRAGAPARLALKVTLPKDIHVQSDKPRDPSLIPTVLTFTAPAGVTVEGIEYPKATDLPQPGRKEPLAVFGSEFTIVARISLAAAVAKGALKVPGVLRYQACNDSVCFPPARATAEWTLEVQ